MDNTAPFQSGFPLHELPDLTEEVFFAYHAGINKIIYLNAAFERVWNITRQAVSSDLSSLINAVHPDDKLHVSDSFTTLLKDRQNQEIEFRIFLPPPQKSKSG